MAKVRVAIIGQGRSGRDIHGHCLVGLPRQYQIVAATDPMKERRDRAASEYGCDVYRDHRQLFGRKDLDLIVNTTPSHLHVPVSLEILKAGYNCLCEKPLAQKVKDVDTLIAAAKKSKRIMGVYQQNRYAPFFEQIQKVIASGVLGRIVQVSFARNGFSRRYDWQTLQENMGGNLLNNGVHELDLLLQLLGADVMPEVACHMDRVNTRGDADDHVLLLLRGKDRPLIQLDVSSCCVYPCVEYRVYGSNGELQGSRNALAWKYIDPKECPRPRLQRRPLANEQGEPAYCSDTLKWQEGRWKLSAAKSKNIFGFMAEKFYKMLHQTLTAGAPLGVTLEEIRQQAAVIEECQRQNPAIYGRRVGGRSVGMARCWNG